VPGPDFGRDFLCLEPAMSSTAKPSSRNFRPETRLVHHGILRSQFGETSEALFLT
jgi:O-succinylhomoserine sulfhydrylase